MNKERIKLISDVDEKRIDAWLSKKLENFSRTYIQKLIDGALVQVNGKNVKSNYKIRLNDEIIISVLPHEKLDVKAENIELDIIYEDNDIIVVNKPKGMVVHPAAGNHSGTLVNALMAYCGDRLSDINGVIRPGIVHRIDKDTSGVLVVAKSNPAHEKLSQSLKIHNIKRVYAAILEGVVREEFGKVDAPIGRHHTDRKKMSVNIKNGRRAVTSFRVLERFNNATLVELELETGRTHQIRVHMSYIGYPVMGDTVYGKKNNKYNTNGQVLHAKILGFVHPIKNEYMEFIAPLPEYFEEILRELRENQINQKR